MDELDILGLPIEEALDVVKNNFSDLNIEIKKTFAWNKEEEHHLNQARVLKILEHKDKLTIITGYF